MPYENEHSCRLRSPGDFEDGSFRRVKSGKVALIVGRLKGQTTTTTQAIRYPKSEWTEAEAAKDCRGHKGSFHPAAKSGAQEFGAEYLDPARNDYIKLGGE